jgi:hypothetical protein
VSHHDPYSDQQLRKGELSQWRAEGWRGLRLRRTINETREPSTDTGKMNGYLAKIGESQP